MKVHHFLLQKAFPILGVAFLWMQTAHAAVTFTVSPTSVSNTYNGYITLQVNGLNTGQTVVVQKYIDANSNGVVDAGDYLVQQFTLTDGRAGMVIGGITNLNVPGDTTGTDGAITANLNFHNGDLTQNAVGQYLYLLSSTNGAFSSITKSLVVTNFPFGQQFTGTVVSNGTSTAVADALVVIFPQPRGGDHGPGTPVAATMANNSGVYSIKLPAGTYVPLAFKTNFVGNYSTSPVLTLTNGQTLNTNLTMSNATATISGSFVDATNSSIGLPGLFMPGSANGLLAPGFSDTNGNFTIGVASGNWSLGSYGGGLVPHGYVGYDNNPTNANSGATGVTIPFQKGTALIYGNISDVFGNPLAGVPVEAYDSNSAITNGNNTTYDVNGYTDNNGNYVLAVVGGLGANDLWQVNLESGAPSNYTYTLPAVQQNNGTNITVGQAVQVNWTALLATNLITGHVRTTNNSAIVGVGVYAYSYVGTNFFQTGTVDTDSNGNYTLSVGNSNTWYVSVLYCCDNDSLSQLGNYQQPDDQSANITNNNATVNFSVQVCSGVQIFTTSLPNAVENNYYDVFLSGNTCNDNQQWFLNDPADFPSSLNLGLDGEISGYPDSSGTYNFSVQLNDGNGHYTNQSLSLTIIGELQITTSSLPNATNGVFYSQTLQATGGFTPYSWGLEPGSANPPANLTLSSNGVISGIPTVSGNNFEFIVQVMDTNSDVSTQLLSINVTGGASPLQITTTSLPNGTNGTSYSKTLQATGGSPPYNWTIAPGSANPPANLTLATNGVLSGTLLVAGTNLEFIAQVTDTASNLVQKVLSMNIVASTNLQRPILSVVRNAGEGLLEFTFTSTSGVNYSVLSSSDLQHWGTVLAFTGSGSLETISVPTTNGVRAMFYRVKAGP